MKKEQIIQHNFFEKVTTLWEIERLKIQHDHIFLSLNQNIKIIYKKNLIEFWIVTTNIIYKNHKLVREVLCSVKKVKIALVRAGKDR